MNSARVISERQKKGTLSAQKVKTKPVKLVLTNNEIEFWPCIDENQRQKFLEIVQRISDNDRKHIKVGLESTLRLLNNGKANYLIIGNEFSPKFCAKHLISLTLNKNPNTKVFIVERLKELTKNLLKVPAIIFSINNSLEMSELNAFYQHLNVHDEWMKNYRRIEKKIDVVVKKKKRKIEEAEPKIAIIKKSEEIDLVADAENDEVLDDEKSTNITNDFHNNSEFISFSEKSSFISLSSTPLYRPIKVKRVTPNPNRSKNCKKRKILE